MPKGCLSKLVLGVSADSWLGVVSVNELTRRFSVMVGTSDQPDSPAASIVAAPGIYYSRPSECGHSTFKRIMVL